MYILRLVVKMYTYQCIGCHESTIYIPQSIDHTFRSMHMTQVNHFKFTLSFFMLVLDNQSYLLDYP